jgi:hypothetical protein
MAFGAESRDYLKAFDPLSRLPGFLEAVETEEPNFSDSVGAAAGRRGNEIDMM